MENQKLGGALGSGEGGVAVRVTLPVHIKWNLTLLMYFCNAFPQWKHV